MIEITPTILTSSKQEFEERLSKISGLVERIQVDVIDGIFTDNKTVDLDEVSRAGFRGKIDFHLMVLEPINWIEKSAKFGADFLIGHIEKMKNQLGFVRQVKEAGMKVGLGLDLGTKIEEVDRSLWSQLDGVLIMSVKTGFSGQKFQERAFELIKRVREIKKNLDLDFDIIVDGGVNLENAKKVVEAGANVLAMGNAIWEAEDIKERIKDLRVEIEK